MVKIIECPRDAMQGIKEFIPIQKKIQYLNSLLKVGFDTLDFGSFVSPKAIPQLKDTEEVLEQLELKNSNTKLLAIVANERGGLEAASHKEIHYLGFPYSISPTFLKRNINSDLDKAFELTKTLQQIASENNKKLVAYISMAFGNPYGDVWSEELVVQHASKLKDVGVSVISLADTTGVGTPESIGKVYSLCRKQVPGVELGLHLHTNLQSWKEKISAAYDHGCRRFDGVLNGLGGCPMAGEELVGNINTTNLIEFLAQKGEKTVIDFDALQNSLQIADTIYD